jgi:molybdate transport system regulatory protein
LRFDSSLTLLDSDTPFLLEKRIKLLSAINEVGSISKASKLVPMSYKTAWEAIDNINNLCPKIVVKKETGGKGGGGAILTLYGRNLLDTYQILQKEHDKFLSALTQLTDFNTGTLKSLQRFTMQISARNQILGTIEKIEVDKVNANIILKTKSNQRIISSISKNSIENLNLEINKEVLAIFKSNNVMIATNELKGFSARNKLKGVISNLNFSEVNCEVTVMINETDCITSVITSTAAKELELHKMQEIYTIIKSSDIMIGN